MTFANILLLAAGGILLLFGAIMLIVSLVKKASFLKMILPGIATVAGITVCIIGVISISSANKLTDRQNFVACELLELESYDAAKDMAELANERKNNITSAKIISLSLGYAGESELCAKVCESFLTLYPDDSDLLEIKKFCDAHNKSIEELDKKAENLDYDYDYDTLQSDILTETELFKKNLSKILKSVKNDISVKDEDSCEDVAKALNHLETGETKKASSLADDLDQDDPLTLQLNAKVSAEKGDYDEAFAYLEKLVNKDPTISNKVALASAAINGGYSEKSSDSEVKAYKNKLKKLEKERKELEKELDDVESEERKSLIAELSKINSQIESLESRTGNIEIYKAINYIESDYFAKDSAVCNALLSELYYLMDNLVKAQEYADKFLGSNIIENLNERLAIDVQSVLDYYSGNAQDPDAAYEIASRIEDIVDRISFSCADTVKDDDNDDDDDDDYYDDYEDDYDDEIEDNFASYLSGMIKTASNSLHISQVSSVDLENFEVSVNLSRESLDGQDYTKEDFRLFDMGVEVTDFTVTSNSARKSSVCLVVDCSGSMSGQSIEMARNAAANFARNANSNVEVGLVGFESDGYTLCEVTASAGAVVNATEQLDAGGGTDIASGLYQGMAELKNASGQKIVILLSDGADSNESGIRSAVEELMRDDIILYCVGFGGADFPFLNEIAQSTGGKLMIASDSTELNSLYGLISNYISNDYTFTFKTTQKSDALTRTVRIVMNDGYYSELEYTLGPTEENVIAINGEAPKSDCYQQVGGSNKNGGAQQ